MMYMRPETSARSGDAECRRGVHRIAVEGLAPKLGAEKHSCRLHPEAQMTRVSAEVTPNTRVSEECDQKHSASSVSARGSRA